MIANACTTRAHHSHAPNSSLMPAVWGVAALLWMLVPCSAKAQSTAMHSAATPATVHLVQWSAPLSSGLTPEQLIFALRKRELSAAHNPECSSLHNKVQRLRRAERRATTAQKEQAVADLAQAQQRQHMLRCPQKPKL